MFPVHVGLRLCVGVKLSKDIVEAGNSLSCLGEVNSSIPTLIDQFHETECKQTRMILHNITPPAPPPHFLASQSPPPSSRSPELKPLSASLNLASPSLQLSRIIPACVSPNLRGP